VYANPQTARGGAGDRCHADPADGCVRNRPGITDPAVLVRVEAECAYGWDVPVYLVRPDLRRFYVDHLRGVHPW
jgi:hypothetical protein